MPRVLFVAVEQYRCPECGATYGSPVHLSTVTHSCSKYTPAKCRPMVLAGDPLPGARRGTPGKS